MGKEKINTFLDQNEKETIEKMNRSDDDKSVREVIEKPDKDDQSSSVGTLSEQESIRSETGTEGVYEVDNNNEILNSLREDNLFSTDENHNDIIQDVLDVNVLLCKLRSILLENGMMDGGEKIDSRKEKSIIDENNELKKQILSLQSNLEDKQKRINSLELQLTSQMKALNNAFTQT